MKDQKHLKENLQEEVKVKRKDKKLDKSKQPIYIDWENIIFEIIILITLIMILFIACTIGSSAHYVSTPIAGINKQLMVIHNVAEIRGQKMYEEQVEKEKQEQNFKMAFEWFLVQAFGYYPSEDEITLVKGVCMAEGGNTESIDGLIAIFSVIRNRVLDPRFPNTITEVCYQKYQFQTVTEGTIWKYEINDKVEEAWDSFLEGGYNDYPDICFFTAGGYNPYCKPAYKLGNHYFGY